jgi:hypothetical protein
VADTYTDGILAGIQYLRSLRGHLLCLSWPHPLDPAWPPPGSRIASGLCLVALITSIIPLLRRVIYGLFAIHGLSTDRLTMLDR